MKQTPKTLLHKHTLKWERRCVQSELAMLLTYTYISTWKCSRVALSMCWLTRRIQSRRIAPSLLRSWFVFTDVLARVGPHAVHRILFIHSFNFRRVFLYFLYFIYNYFYCFFFAANSSLMATKAIEFNLIYFHLPTILYYLLLTNAMSSKVHKLFAELLNIDRSRVLIRVLHNSNWFNVLFIFCYFFWLLLFKEVHSHILHFCIGNVDVELFHQLSKEWLVFEFFHIHVFRSIS